MAGHPSETHFIGITRQLSIGPRFCSLSVIDYFFIINQRVQIFSKMKPAVVCHIKGGGGPIRRAQAAAD